MCPHQSISIRVSGLSLIPMWGCNQGQLYQVYLWKSKLNTYLWSIYCRITVGVFVQKWWYTWVYPMLCKFWWPRRETRINHWIFMVPWLPYFWHSTPIWAGPSRVQWQDQGQAGSTSFRITAGLPTIPRPEQIRWSRNPAPVDRWFIPLFIGFQPCKWCRIFATIHSITRCETNLWYKRP
jgi:hypothetical protein